MAQIRKFTYEEMCEMLKRKEIIVFDTNVLLDLFVFTFDDLKEIMNSFEEDYYIHKIFITPHIYEEYINGLNKIRNTYIRSVELKKEQVRGIYKKMMDSINIMKNNLGNSVGFLKVVELTNDFYNNICAKIDDVNYGDLLDYAEKENLINRFVEIFINNYYRVSKFKIPIYLDENFWNSDRKKSKNSFGDLIIWNEILLLANNLSAESLYLVENEGKKEWTVDKLHNSLHRNVNMGFEIRNFKEFILNHISAVSDRVIHKCMDNYDRYCQYLSISTFLDLSKKYAIIKNFRPLGIFQIKRLIEENLKCDFDCFDNENKIIILDVKILSIDDLKSSSEVETDVYDEVRLCHTFKQKIECQMLIRYKDKIEVFTLDSAYIAYSLVSTRIMYCKEESSIDEYIKNDVEYDYLELERKLKNML